jgi:hypothetical protein
MKNRGRIGLSILSAALLASATWALPTAASNGNWNQDTPKASAQLQSVSGTISTVQRDSFTLVTTSGTPRGAQFQQDRDETKTMMLIIDQNTTVDGKLKAGANADVVYRLDNGNNVAVSVTVSK